MKPTTTAQIRKEEDRKKRRAAKDRRRWLEDRRREMQAEGDRRRKLLLFLLLMFLDSKPARLFFPPYDPAPVPPPASAAQPKRRRKRSDETGERPSFNHEEHICFDYSTRPEERHLHVMDGLTYEDIIDLDRTHRPYLFKTPAPIPGTPDRYSYKEMPPHVWTLLDHLGSPYHRPDALTALRLVVNEKAHDWIDACATREGGWKELKRCRTKTPAMTLAEFPRAAARWREAQRREDEERKKESKETPDNGPKPPSAA